MVLIINMITAIVRNEDCVEVEREVDVSDISIIFHVRVAKEDMGLVIGRAGVTATAIKHIVKLISFKQKVNINIKFEEPKI